MNQPDKRNILSLIKTKSEANTFFEFINILRDKTFKTEKVSEETLKLIFKDLRKQKNDEYTPEWVEYISKELGGNFRIDSVREVLDSLEKIVSKAELIKIEISFEPTKNFCHEAYKIIEDCGIKNFLLEIEVNEEMPIGAKFFIEGKYIDLTMKKVINNYLREKDAVKRYL